MANKWTAPLRERDITRQIAREHFQEFDRLIESDVIVVGAGPSGLLCARDLAAAYDAGVRVLNLTKVIDLILRRENILEGVVVNWSPVEYAGHDAVHVDPIALESQLVVDATGHDAAVVALLNKRGLYKAVPGNGAMWVERSEELVVENTREVYPNCFLAGLSVSAVDGSPRMGPAFGAMLLSGRRAAELVKKKLKQE